ncbi:MAG: RNA methyltransferase, partial [Deltaproteobacteria bacterium]
MPDKINPDHITIVLQKPRYPENIGAAARAIRNMGIGKLAVVEPENFDTARVRKMATHAAADVVEKIIVHESLPRALADFNYIVGTTARSGGQRRTIDQPEKLADKLISISHENRIAIVFGPEDRGLSNADIRLCHALVTIPTAEFSSLNLAQAVMVICYELFKAGLTAKKKFTPRLATRYELEGMYDQLSDILVKISYINPENPAYWMNKLRHFFNRLPLRAREVSIIRGICRQINWYG